MNNIEFKEKDKFNSLVKLTSSFCRQFLDEEYKNLCEKVIIHLTDFEQVPFLKGKIEI